MKQEYTTTSKLYTAMIFLIGKKFLQDTVAAQLRIEELKLIYYAAVTELGPKRIV